MSRSHHFFLVGSWLGTRFVKAESASASCSVSRGRYVWGKERVGHIKGKKVFFFKKRKKLECLVQTPPPPHMSQGAKNGDLCEHDDAAQVPYIFTWKKGDRAFQKIKKFIFEKLEPGGVCDVASRCH